MKKTNLLKEENQLLKAVEVGRFESKITKSRKKTLEKIAKNTLKMLKRDSIISVQGKSNSN